jgi:ketosteroid isomerase-like protein
MNGHALPAAADEHKTPIEVFRDIVQNLIDAENRGDTDDMAALFTSGAILLPPGAAEPIEGDFAIRRFLADYAKNKMNNHTIKPTVILQASPLTMIEAGTWSGDVPAQDASTPAAHVTGTYLAVGVSINGQWKLWADSWQSKSNTGSSIPPQVGNLPGDDK